ncbi:hypothetical protein [Halorussus halophilus]|uniref:hypothetical protein n=1 Tax=Halorussus halophilus TaxID=2650975 RepID=UPI001CE4ADA6|nr:hypothetical protein [Halorussus halophilus]
MTGDGERDDSNEAASRSDGREPLGEVAAEVRSRRGEQGEGSDASDVGGARSSRARDGPLSGLADEVDERRQRQSDGSPFESFESVEVEELDGEKLWALLADEDGETVGVAAPREESEDDRDVRTIPKNTCHGCPHFADPPEVACTHEGTSILELVETERFRVADCPMVVDDDQVRGIDAELEAEE